MKRTLDVIVSLMLLVLLFPLFILVSLAVRINLGSPVLFKQMRPGLHGKPFYLYKFRSMNNRKDQEGKLLPDYQRLNKFGKYLRKSSLDEIPQLFNVLKGDLSLVGPRPLLMQYLPLYSSEQSKRHLVKPGITGWAQINGRNTISWEEKFELDVWYVSNQSLLLDLKILWKTFEKVLRSSGVNQEGHITMEVFTGTKDKGTEREGTSYQAKD